jgi:hypothetical protein
LGPFPATQEDGRHNGAVDHHCRILGDEKEGELDAPILGHETRDKLILCLGQIKGRAIALGQDGDEEEKKA